MKNFNNEKRQQGFTLIELMVTVAIVAILAAVAYPSYTQQVLKGKRSDAKVELLRIAQLQESFFVQNLTYAPDLTSLGFTTDAIDTEQNSYQVQVTASGPGACTTASPCSTYTLSAAPQGTQVHDIACGTFTINNTALKGVSVSGNAQMCWR